MKYSPYSHSKIGCYEDCPHKFFLKYIKKIKITLEPKFFEKGNFYHKVLEKYPEIPKFNFKYSTEEKQELYLKNILAFIENEHTKELLENSFGAEIEFKFDESLEPTNISKWKSGLYGYIDYVGKTATEIHIVDWKSKDHGSRFPTNKKQLEMYAAWIFAVRPNLQKIICEFAYIEDIKFETFTFTREDGELFTQDIINRIDVIESDSDFKKAVRKSCSKCDYFEMCKPYHQPITRKR